MTPVIQPPAQRAFEFGLFKKFIRENNVMSFLEIGSRYGGSLYEAAKAMPVGSKVVSVDLVDGLWGRSDSRPHLEHVIATLNDEGYKASVIFGDSTTPSVIRRVHERGPYDMILLDGDHKIEGVTLDWINYHKIGKYVAFHDIDGQEHFYSKTFDWVDVPWLWKALRRRYKHKQFVDMEDRGMGIGVLMMNEPIKHGG